QAIAASGCSHLIFRTSWVYGTRGKNFLRTILRLAAEREELSIVGDQQGAPTSARMIADATAHIVSQAMRERRSAAFESGLFNLTAAGATTWHGFAQAIIEA
ncbi:sugar nucleotide-binding protein, partial [Burkholderia sp. SIMBA_048]|uniref:sugar nucleotide-binding protein n=1 Tax=Burkholderia sp. SIMBA_048 TaxID=3085789 RepID=UPI00397A0EF5